MRAGVIPAWKSRARGDGEPIAVITTPNTNPFEQLWVGLIHVGFDAEKVAFVREPSPTLFQDLAVKLPEVPQFLILIDQFEELFTRIPKKDRKLRNTFVEALVNASTSAQTPVPPSPSHPFTLSLIHI